MHINSSLGLIRAETELPEFGARIVPLILLNPIGLINVAERGNLPLEQIWCRPADPAFPKVPLAPWKGNQPFHQELFHYQQCDMISTSLRGFRPLGMDLSRDAFNNPVFQAL